MIKNIIHVGISVSDLEKAKDFYGNILGLKFVGQMIMKGEETDLLFNRKNTVAKVAYFNGSDNIYAPPIELIEFNHTISKAKADLFKTSISEVCFSCDDIDKTYNDLKNKGVKFISEPQFFDSTEYGFSKSKAVYFYDMDENILELTEYID